MVSIPGQFEHLLSGLPTWPLVIIMLVVSLLLVFIGRKVVKILAFLVVGLVGASIGGILGAQYLAGLGWFGKLMGVLIGFFAGGLVGVALVAVGIGVAAGYAAYLLTLDIVSDTTVALVLGIIFFIIGLALYGKILSVITAVIGGLLLYDALRLYGLGSALSVALALMVTLAGIWIQSRSGRRTQRPTFSSDTSI
ncbi:MAG: hypothetical protein ABR867_01240 [Nitrososphaerales archaeon]